MNFRFVALCALFCLVSASPLVRKKRAIVEDSQWSSWGPCDANCDGGYQERMLECTDTVSGARAPCKVTKASCNLMPCINIWEPFGDCTATCDGGTRRRVDKTNTYYQDITCSTQDCTPVTGCGKADLVFVLDSSGSLGDLNWYRTKQFVLDVVGALNMAQDETRVGVVSFSTEVHASIDLGDYSSTDDLEAQVWALPYQAGSTNTADGLRMARGMLEARTRSDVQSIVVVLTDGQSNILNETTIPQADETRALATIFSIGVGNVADAELKGIANDPDATHYFYVSDYEALDTITMSIINQACETANQVECDEWSEWSDCNAPCDGTGTTARSQTCRLIDSLGEVQSTFVRTETNTCQGVACDPPTPPPTPPPTTTTTAAPTPPPTTTTAPPPTTTTTPPPTTTTTEAPVPVVDCTLCTFVNGLGYMVDPTNCQCYHMCQRVDAVTTIDHGISCCANGLYWNDVIRACDWPTNVDTTFCLEPTAPQDEVELPDDPVVCTIDADPTDVTRFVQNGVVMSCASGTVWDALECTCVDGFNPPVTSVCEEDIFLYFPFDDHFNDVECNKAVSDIYGDPTLSWDARLGKSVYFNGQSKLAVQFLNNWFANKEERLWTVSVWIKLDGGASSLAGLVNNGDCVDTASFDVFLNGGAVTSVGASVDTSVTARTVLAPYEVTAYEWHHVAMVYNDYQLTLYVDGALVQNSVAATGYIENRHCPMNIGHEGPDATGGFFKGYMDELKIYRKAISAAEILDLYMV